MTLKSYYSALEDPKKTIRDMIMDKCDVSRETVYNWINGKTNPSKAEQEIISQITDIPVEQLFPKA